MTRYRIGEVARRTGTSAALLRAWETRYGLLGPERSAGGTRLYADADIGRVEAMQRYLTDGLSAAQAAEAVLAEVGLAGDRRDPERPPAATAALASAETSELETARVSLRAALSDLDRERADGVLDHLLGFVPVGRLIGAVIVPYLEDVGLRWARGETGIAEEHLATNVIRGRFLALARRPSPLAMAPVVLACPPGERHDLPLVLVMAMLATLECPTLLLGADTPMATIAEAAEAVGAGGVVVSATFAESLGDNGEALIEIARRWPTFIAGAGASATLAEHLGVRELDDILAAAPVIAAARREAGTDPQPAARP